MDYRQYFIDMIQASVLNLIKGSEIPFSCRSLSINGLRCTLQRVNESMNKRLYKYHSQLTLEEKTSIY